ncbi:MAG: hypothetical protein IT439_01220 [Phycisphaerales bacterium]|nr:hypothetical protein [Phycisphaerales bacterium]
MKTHSLCAVLAALVGSTWALGDTVTVIYSKVARHPSAVVPGAVDLDGNPATTEWRALEDLIVSPDGSMWGIKGRTQLGSDLESTFVLGSGLAGTTELQEGRPIPGGAPGELMDFLGSSFGRFDSHNNFVYTARARGGSPSTFQKVLHRDASTSTTTIAIQMGDPILGLADADPNPSGDETFGNSIGSVHLLDDGTIGSQDSTIQNISSLRRPAIMYDDAAIHQANVSSVAGLGGAGTPTLATINANSFYSSADGGHRVFAGRINGFTSTTDDVLVVDDEVVMQEGSLIPGSTVTFAAVFHHGMLTNGRWYARGDDLSDNDWAAINGDVVVKTGDPIVPASFTAWGSVFLSFNTNHAGDWVLAGNTVDPDGSPDTDDMLVLNGARVLLREGDPVDLDNNGIFDDGAYIGRGNVALSAFEPNDLFITASGEVYVFVNLRSAPDDSGVDLGSDPAFGTPSAFLRISTANACPADLSGSSDPNDPAYGQPDGAVDSADFFYYLDQFVGGNVAVADLSGSSDPNDPAYGVPDGMIDAADFFYYLDLFVNGCP